MMNRFLGTLLVASTTLLGGCSEKEWDVAPLNIEMAVRDADGNDLLSPSCDHNIVENDIYVLYQDSTYHLNAHITEEKSLTFGNDQSLTRAYFAQLQGVTIVKDGDGYKLSFGEFDGARDWNDSFEIFWGDDTSDTVSFERKFKWALDGSPKVTSSALYLNNKKMKELVIVK